jgi:hypothetical protein
MCRNCIQTSAKCSIKSDKKRISKYFVDFIMKINYLIEDDGRNRKKY